MGKIRSFGIKWQRLFFIPKQLTHIAKRQEFADAEAAHLLNFTNNIIKFNLNGSTYYFKEARERRGFKEYIFKSVERFFEEVCKDPLLKETVLKSLSVKSNFKKLVNLGEKSVEGSPFNKYLNSNDESVLGLPPVAEDKKEKLRKFIFYIYGEINNYHYNFGVKKGDRQTFLAVRAIGVKQLADNLSIGHLVPQTDFVKITLNGCERYGSLESRAEGVDASLIPLDERKERITPQLLRELTSLNILDALSHDNDHRINNYHTLSDGQGNFIGVTSFDNDSPSVFFPSPKVNFKHTTNCSNIIDRRGYINRPHMDKRLAECVLSLNKNSLNNFCDYLNGLQRSCLYKRLRKLQRAILKTQKVRADFLLEKDGWTTAHIEEELSGEYGKTYLISFLTDCYYSGGLHPYDEC